MSNFQANIERFSGFSELYDENRPKPPEIVTGILMQYLNKTPELVLDLGSGTGLSTFIWCGKAKKIIGIEPNDDMRNQAGIKAAEKCVMNVIFKKADAYNTGLDHRCADIVTCSQSFHWMEPTRALKEIARTLKPGGIFAAYDCDWPPVAGHIPEKAYNNLLEAAREKLGQIPDKKKAVQFPKEEHLKNIRESGYFNYCREIVFHNMESCPPERFIRIALSQGAVQTLLKDCPEQVEDDIRVFRQKVLENWKENMITVSYRMRMGIRNMSGM